jgi:hypothetical protein
VTDFGRLIAALASQRRAVHYRRRFRGNRSRVGVSHRRVRRGLRADAREYRPAGAALELLSPYLRGAPPGLPFRLDTGTVTRAG